MAAQASIPASSTGFNSRVLPEMWPLAGLVESVGWLWRGAGLAVCAASAGWIVRPTALQEGQLFEGRIVGKWAATGASASLSECFDPLFRICCPSFVFGVV